MLNAPHIAIKGTWEDERANYRAAELRSLREGGSKGWRDKEEGCKQEEKEPDNHSVYLHWSFPYRSEQRED